MNNIEIDNTARNRIVSEIDRNFFVEAGAGSGKTTMLVNRMVAMVEAGIDISGLTTHAGKNELATIDLQFQTKGLEEIKTVMNKIRQIDGIEDVTRSVG